MTNDLISRQAAVDALADYIHNVDRVYANGHLTGAECVDAAKSVLDELPSVTPEQRWIPVKTALPEEERSVLITTTDCGITIGSYEPSLGKDFWFFDCGESNGSTEYVVAWCELPESYKGGD